MSPKKAEVPCVVCNSAGAQPGDYCERHLEEVHRLDHSFEHLFRLQRTFRGRDYEIYDVFLQGECGASGRIIVAETDPENLVLTVMVSEELDLNARIKEYDALKIEKTFRDKLRERIERDIIRSWYGNASACIEVFSILDRQPEHWDISAGEPDPGEEEEMGEPHPHDGNKHSVH
jgi:hypothetical protein